MVRDAVETGLLIAKRRHQLNRDGGVRRPGEPRMRQGDLAALLDVAASTVANWERGKSFPERHLGDVERVLGVSLTGAQEEADPEREKMLLHDSIDRMDAAELARLVEAYRAIKDGSTGPRRRRAG